MNTVRTLTLRPPRARKRMRWALLLFVALALGSATAGLLNQQSGRPGRTAAPRVVVTVTPGTADPSADPSADLSAAGTPTAAAVPTLPAQHPLSPLGPLAPAATVTVPPSTTPPGLPVPSASPTRPSPPQSTASPTRTPTRSPSPTTATSPSTPPTSSPTPVLATPRVAAAATGSSYRSGAYVRGKVVVSGLPSGYAGDATLRLHGPFPSSVEIDCAAASIVRTDTVHVTGDGTWHGPTKAIKRRGFYVWEAVLPAGPSSHAASSPCPTRSGRFEVTW